MPHKGGEASHGGLCCAWFVLCTPHIRVPNDDSAGFRRPEFAASAFVGKHMDQCPCAAGAQRGALGSAGAARMGSPSAPVLVRR